MKKFRVGHRVIYGEGGYEDYEEYEARIRSIAVGVDGESYYLEDKNGLGLGYYDGDDLKFAPTRQKILDEKIRRAYAQWKLTPEEQKRTDEHRLAMDKLVSGMERTMMMGIIESPSLGGIMGLRESLDNQVKDE